MRLPDRLEKLRQLFFGDIVRTFGWTSLLLLLLLAVAPAKHFFADWHRYQRGYERLISNRSDAVTLRRHFEPGIQQIWLPEMGVSILHHARLAGDEKCETQQKQEGGNRHKPGLKPKPKARPVLGRAFSNQVRLGLGWIDHDHSLTGRLHNLENDGPGSNCVTTGAMSVPPLSSAKVPIPNRKVALGALSGIRDCQVSVHDAIHFWRTNLDRNSRTRDP